jgi:acetylornithine deacetylase/succinyl-diaminopimelate desuccinylase-like protein
MGRNAIHRVGGLLGDLDRYQERRPVIDGCEYREAVQAVRIEGGVAGNVVPDEVVLLVNHRFAPDRTPAQAEGFRSLADISLKTLESFPDQQRFYVLETQLLKILRLRALEIEAQVGG